MNGTGLESQIEIRSCISTTSGNNPGLLQGVHVQTTEFTVQTCANDVQTNGTSPAI